MNKKYKNLEKRMYTDEKLRELNRKLLKERKCFNCNKKADIGCEIALFTHCRKCYRDYYKEKHSLK